MHVRVVLIVKIYQDNQTCQCWNSTPYVQALAHSVAVVRFRSVF